MYHFLPSKFETGCFQARFKLAPVPYEGVEEFDELVGGAGAGHLVDLLEALVVGVVQVESI